MKKLNLFLSMMTLGLLLLSSCVKEELEIYENNNHLAQNYKDASVVKGRFFFSSKETLSERIKMFQEKEDFELENEFEKLYQKGFRSHKPIVNSENDRMIEMLSNEYVAKRKTIGKSITTGDDDEGFLADPHFAAIVNEDNEIIVGDTLYKYTKDSGLFFTHVKDSLSLFEYVENISNSKSKSFMVKSASPCEEMLQHGGVTDMDGTVSRYIRPYACGGGGGAPPRQTKLDKFKDLVKISNNLSICDGEARGNEFQNLFGISKVCRSYFGKRHRIKTEFWNHNYGLYASTGVLTKTQRQRGWIWWASKSDEVVLGINRIALKFNHFKKPDFSVLNNDLTLTPRAFKSPLFLYKANFYLKDYYGPHIQVQLEVKKNSIPFFEFEDVNLLNIYLPDENLDSYSRYGLSSGDIFSESNIKKLYELAFDFLKDNINVGKDIHFAVTHQKTPEQVEVIYFGRINSVKNKSKLKSYLYKDVGFLIGFFRVI